MPVTYTNRKGVTYYLCRGVTKTGKPRYYFAREIKGEPVDEIPEGFTISESVNAVVSLVRDHPSQILPNEIGLGRSSREATPQGTQLPRQPQARPPRNLRAGRAGRG